MRPLLEAHSLGRVYPARGRRSRGRKGHLVALDGVSLHLDPGEVVGLVGRSGAGKSTVARILAGLDTADSGEVSLDGELVPSGEERRLRQAVQLVFQDPVVSLDPRQSVGGAVVEALSLRGVPRASARDAAAGLFTDVGLARDVEFLSRRPRELSGGQRQRVAVARALACAPRALLLDEPVSALDAAVRGQVLRLLLGLRERHGLALLLITHDLGLAAEMCGRVLVMDAGRVVEEGPARDIMTFPREAQTRALVAAAQAAPGLP